MPAWSAAPSAQVREGAAAELLGDVRVGEQATDAGRPDEEQLVRARPGEEQPAAVRRPRDVAEPARPGEDTARRGRKLVGVEEEQPPVPDDREPMALRGEGNRGHVA